jgi:hypothetical protein
MVKIVERWLKERLQPPPLGHWRRLLMGEGALVVQEEGLRLVLPRASRSHYSNAQIDDYLGLPRSRYPWHPPLLMTVRARFGGRPLGTAGFGFWNHPFAMLKGIPALPRAIWFFYASPPSDIALKLGVPGHGWKVETLDTLRLSALRWAPFAPLVMLLNQWPAAEQRIWPHVERDLQISAASLDVALDQWHDYSLEWRPDRARFTVDGQVVLETDRSPRGPLGFVAWMDNQWAIATPRGRLWLGLLDIHQPQWLDLASVRIERL